MRIEPLLLGRGVDGKSKTRWRAMTGADELALFGSGFSGAVDWLGSMMLPGDDAISGADVSRLAVADGDRLFEAVYRALFGSKVELRNRCADCGEGYELELGLDDLFPKSKGGSEQVQNLPGGTRVRGLTLGDLIAAKGDSSALVERATVARGSDSQDSIVDAIELLTSSHVEMVETLCPHCERAQAFAFDLASFLLLCCERERPILLREIHLLARSYAWSFSEIIALERRARHDLVRLVVAGATQPRGRAA